MSLPRRFYLQDLAHRLRRRFFLLECLAVAVMTVAYYLPEIIAVLILCYLFLRFTGAA